MSDSSSWEPEDDSSGSSEGIHAPNRMTRADGITFSIVQGEIIERTVWVPPCISVLRIHLGLCDSEGLAIAVHETPTSRIPPPPCSLFCTRSCSIQIHGQRRTLLWKWAVMEGGLDSESEDEDEGSSWSSESTCNEDVEESSNEDEDEEDEEGEHTLNFKVVGVTYGHRQNYVECAKQLIAEGNNVPVSLVPETTNVVDPTAISVVIDTGEEHFGEKTVGYIPKEFNQLMKYCLDKSFITKVAIGHIKLQLLFNPIGFYILLKVTRQGRWPKWVREKSRRVK